MKILIIEDNHRLAHEIADALEQVGHSTAHVVDDRNGLLLATSSNFDVIVLDRILAGGADGLSVLRTLRSDGDQTPILLISGMGTVQEKVEGLKAGANDYLAKPVALEELVARIDALNRPRKEVMANTTLCVGDVNIDLLSRVVVRAGKQIDVQPREYKLLEYFMRHPNEVVTRKQLLEAIWKTRFDPGTTVVEVHLSRLRKKIDSPFEQPILHTIRNVGFVLRPVEINQAADGRGELLSDDADLEVNNGAEYVYKTTA